jgi:hypothetical protein
VDKGCRFDVRYDGSIRLLNGRYPVFQRVDEPVRGKEGRIVRVSETACNLCWCNLTSFALTSIWGTNKKWSHPCPVSIHVDGDSTSRAPAGHLLIAFHMRHALFLHRSMEVKVSTSDETSQSAVIEWPRTQYEGKAAPFPSYALRMANPCPVLLPVNL